MSEDAWARAAAVAAARRYLEPGTTIGLGSGRAVFALADALAGAWPGRKLVMACAHRVLIVAERSKYVQRLGSTHPLPVEVVRFAWSTTRRRLLDLVPEATLRRQPTGDPVVTGEGHYLLDCQVPPGDLAALAKAVKSTLGVVEHGLFLHTATDVLLGHDDGTVDVLRREATPQGP